MSIELTALLYTATSVGVVLLAKAFGAKTGPATVAVGLIGFAIAGWLM